MAAQGRGAQQPSRDPGPPGRRAQGARRLEGGVGAMAAGGFAGIEYGVEGLPRAEDPRGGEAPGRRGPLRQGRAAGALLVLLFAAGAASPVRSDAPAPDKYLQAGLDLLKRGACETALKPLEQADSAAHGRCVECLFAIAQAEQCRGESKRALKACERILPLAGDDKALLSRLHNQKGVILAAEGKELAQAEAEFRTALEANDDLHSRFNLGVVLLRRGRDEEGTAVLQECLARVPSGALADEARRLIKNPLRARKDFAPAISLTSLQGEPLTLEQLEGKVVLVDFWATWCGPCQKSAPSVERLAKKFGAEGLVVLGVSGDDSEEAWRSYLAKHELPGLHGRDGDEAVRRAFQVHSFPSFVIVDRQGLVRFRTRGWGQRTAAILEDEIKRALKDTVPASH